MGRPGLPLGLVDGTHEVTDVERDGRTRVPLHEQDSQAVLQDDPLDTVFQAVGRGRDGRQRDEDCRQGCSGDGLRGDAFLPLSGWSHDGR